MLSAVLSLAESFFQSPAPPTTIEPWNPPEIPAEGTIAELETLLEDLREQDQQQEEQLGIITDRLRSSLHSPQVTAAAKQAAEYRTAKNREAIAALRNEVELRRRALFRATRPIARYLRDNPGSNPAEAARELCLPYLDALDRKVLAFAESYLAMLAAGTEVAHELAYIESQIGVSFESRRGPLPPACDLLSCPRLPSSADQFAGAAAAVISNLSEHRPNLAEPLQSLLRQFVQHPENPDTAPASRR